jgi:hypothetical protein
VTQLVSSNGRELTIRPVGEVSMRFTVRAGGPPLKHNGDRVVEDSEARSIARDLLDSGWYDGGKIG